VTEVTGTDCNFAQIENQKGISRTTCSEDLPPLSKDEGSSEVMVNLEAVFFDPDILLPVFKGQNPDQPKKKIWLNGTDVAKQLQKANSWFFAFAAKPDPASAGEFTKEFRLFYEENGHWHVFWGLTKDFRDAFLTSAVLPAFREPINQLRINQWSWFGKLIKRAWEAKRESDPELSQQLENVTRTVEQVGEPFFAEISHSITQKIRVGFADSTVRLKFMATEQTDIYKQVQIWVDDGIDANLSRKGSGIQSAVIIGLFAYYCAQRHGNTSVLVVEEPEIYLHPQARRAISRRLDEFVNVHSEERLNQVIVTTHAAEFVQSGEVATITVARKEHGETVARTISLDDVGTDVRELQRVMRLEGAEMFFADTVILCEGAEVYLLPKIADSLTGANGILDEHNVSVIRVNGKGNFRAYTRVLDGIGVPWHIITDLDFFEDGLDKFKDGVIDPIEFERIKSNMQAIRDDFYRNDPWVSSEKIKKRVADPKSSRTARDFCTAMELWEQNLENQVFLERVFDIWQHVKPQLQKRLTREVIESDEAFGISLNFYFEMLTSTTGIWILRLGELENYVYTGNDVAPEAKKLLQNRKVNDAELFRICQDTSIDINKCFYTGEFEQFLSNILPNVFTSKTKISAHDFDNWAEFEEIFAENSKEETAEIRSRNFQDDDLPF
jgi:putative ATP-dependent endonuclease of the OLD family